MWSNVITLSNLASTHVYTQNKTVGEGSMPKSMLSRTRLYDPG